MSTLSNMKNKNSNDLFDKLIFEKKLRIKTLVIDKELDILLVLFNSGNILKGRLSNYIKLKSASQKELENYRLIKGGIGIRWDDIDEDLSIKGFIKSAALNQALRNLESKDDSEMIFA